MRASLADFGITLAGGMELGNLGMAGSFAARHT
jgi:hypothetical protein